MKKKVHFGSEKESSQKYDDDDVLQQLECSSNSSESGDSRLDSDASMTNDVIKSLVSRVNKLTKKMSKMITSQNI